MLNEEMMQQAG